MKAKLRLFGRPVHQILIVFPLGLLATSFFFDLAWLMNGHAELAIVASWLIFAGVVGGVAASLFGVIDWLAIPRATRAWRVGAWHGGGNLIVAILFAVSWWLRADAPATPEQLAIILSGCGVLLIILTASLGSELADRMEDID